MAERSHLSIGEVLSLLRDEFPDVTISKIRFLESQGLVDPERTPSGYRKFFDQDVERLRWILRQQREHFLPLKVIRGRLVEHGDELESSNGYLEEGQLPLGATLDPSSRAVTHAPEATPLSAGQEAAATADGEGTRGEGGRPLRRPSLFSQQFPPPPAPEPVTRRQSASLGDDAETYSAEELAAAAGATPSLISDLKQYGLIAPHAVVAGTAYYDEGALAVGRAAAEFARHGVEARHLRSWRNAAEREADLFQQVVLPLLRQRNPQSRRQAADTLTELSRLGAELRAALVDRAVKDIR